MSETANITQLPVPKRSIIVAMSERYGMEPKPFEEMMRAVALPKDATDPEFMSCMMVAHGHNLNPITREIFFMRTKTGQIQPIVSIDGWVRKCNEHPAFDGIEFEDTLDDKGNVVSITGKVYRKDRSRPTVVTEYMAECRGNGGGWLKTPTRMLRHRVHIQGARYAFGFAGIMDQDEFDQWQHEKREPRDITPKLEAPPIPDIPVPPPPENTGPTPPDGKAAFLNSLERDLSGMDDPVKIENFYDQKIEEATLLGCTEETEAAFAKRERELEPSE